MRAGSRAARRRDDLRHGTPRRQRRAVRDLRRDPEHGMVAGVCAGLGKRLRRRPAAPAASSSSPRRSPAASGSSPTSWPGSSCRPSRPTSGTRARRDPGPRPPRHRRGRARRGAPLLAVLLGASASWACRSPTCSSGRSRSSPPGARSSGTARRARPIGGRAALRRRRRERERTSRRWRSRARHGESRPAVISRIGIGVTLVVAAAIVFLQFTGALAAATDVALAALVVAIAFGVIFAPWIVRLGDVADGRARRAHPLAGARRGRRAPARLGPADARARAEARRRPARGRGARAPPGARAADVAVGHARARRRRALAGRRARGGRAGDRGRRTASPIDVVAVGDAQLDHDGEALVAAAREAMLNAAKFAGGAAPVAVYAEAGERAAGGLRPRPRARLRLRPRCRPTGAACASRSSGAWSATAGARRSTRRRAAAPRSSSCSTSVAGAS